MDDHERRFIRCLSCMWQLGVLIALSFGIAFVHPAHSSNRMTGAQFLDACTRLDHSWISFCNGYVQAVVDGVEHPIQKHCIPTGTTRATIVDATVRRLKATPELRKLNAASVVFVVLLRTFPCR